MLAGSQLKVASLTKYSYQKRSDRSRIRPEWGLIFLPIEDILLCFFSGQEHVVARREVKKWKARFNSRPHWLNSCPWASSFLLHQVKGGLAGRQVDAKAVSTPVSANTVLHEPHPRGQQISPLTWRHWDELVLPLHAATYDWGHKHHQDNHTPCTPRQDVNEPRVLQQVSCKNDVALLIIIPGWTSFFLQTGETLQTD